MPIMASQGRSDARGTAQLLASMALDCMENPGTAPEQAVALNNVFRMLESYRTNPRFGLESLSTQVAQSVEKRLTLRRPVERHVREVRNALEHALALAFVGTGKDLAVQRIEAVLRSITYPEASHAGVSPEDQNLTTRFFEVLVSRLQAG